MEEKFGSETYEMVIEKTKKEKSEKFTKIS